MTARSRTLTAVIVVGLVALAGGAIARCAPEGRDGFEGCAPESPESPASNDAAVSRVAVHAAPEPALAPGCTSHRTRACDAGDAWWFDSCGNREHLIEACGDRVCSDGACTPPPDGPACGQLTEQGQCAGDVLHYCKVGHVHTVDCAAIGQRCGANRDGELECLSDRPCADKDRCLGRRASVCIDGRRTLVPCAIDERCELDDDGRARCAPRPPFTRLCHGCPCPLDAPDLPQPIPAIAFVVADDAGHTVESEDRVRATFAITAESFAAAGVPLVLSEIRTLRRPSWIDANLMTVHEAELDPELHPTDKPFFIPIVVVRELRVGVKYAGGLGTLPGGGCADLPKPQVVSDDGIVMLAHERYPTALTHELGHYFGLCHTHEPDPPLPHILLDDTGAPTSCLACRVTGDGICDTPLDPGTAGKCVLDTATCTATCPHGAVPDATNLMSYYADCRRTFTPQQAMYLRRFAKRRMDSRPAH